MEYVCGCELNERLHQGSTSIVYRGRRVDDDRAVIVKVLAESTRSWDALASLRHEHAILEALASDGVPRSQGLVHDTDRDLWALLLDDTGGRSLESLALAGKLSIGEFLDLAIAITGIVEDIHEQGVIHKDINPSHLVWNAEQGRLVLVDFGIATVLPRETAAFVGPQGLQGTLAYISPEQTGRMNRALDYRTDFYSLGVTLYQLATGRLPFDTQDPLALVHAHIARQPPSLTDGVGPLASHPAVAAIVEKLLAKNADDRYRSARGIRADLVHCAERVREGGAGDAGDAGDAGIGAFSPGRSDRAEHVQLPHRLYGRADEVERILSAFDRASHGEATLLMVSGAAGVGKSALIREVYRPLTARRGSFIAGKFEQYGAGEPYVAFVQALRALIAQILTEPKDRFVAWQTRIARVVAGGASALMDVCPELALVLGDSPAAETVAPAEARTRFQRAVYALLTAFATPEHPLCIFLDDLQWADADSLDLIEQLIFAAQDVPVLLIGAYRDNEVGDGHPVRLMLREIEKHGRSVERVELAPLTSDDVIALVADALSLPADTVAPLARLSHARTGGNPFFLRTFLGVLDEDGLIEATEEGWRWDLERIRQRGVTENVVQFLERRVLRLPVATRELLKVAACIGGEFDLGTLAVASGESSRLPKDSLPDTIAPALWPGATQDLVRILAPVHSVVDMSAATPETRCRFVHDNIQQAMLAALDEDALANLHLDIGRRLWRGLDADAREQRLFDIVGHLDRGRSALTDPGEREELARHNLRAAHKALDGAAAQPALDYARTGLALLDGGDWDARYEFTRDLHVLAVEAAFIGGELEEFQRLAGAVLEHARTVTDKAIIWKLQGQKDYAQGNLPRAMELYRNALEHLGCSLPVDPDLADGAEAMRAVSAAMGERAIEDLLELPACNDPDVRLTMELLEYMVTMAFTAGSGLLPVVTGRLVELSIRHGNSPYSAWGYVFYGFLCGFSHDVDRAYRLGRVALDLAQRFGGKEFLARVYQYANACLIHWKEPLSRLPPAFLSAHRYAVEVGDRFYAASSAASLCQTRFLIGDELGELIGEMAEYGELCRQLRQPHAHSWIQVYEQAAINLHRGADEPSVFAGPVYDEATRIPEHQADNAHGSLFNYHYCKMLVCYLFGDFANAAKWAASGESYRAMASSGIWAGPWTLLDCLCRLAVYPDADEDGQREIRDVVANHVSSMENWLGHCPVDIKHKVRLVEAERDAVLGRPEHAARAFDEAVVLAHKSGYVHEAALACELAGRFFLGIGRAERARDLLREAHRGYLRWGAIAKVRALEDQYRGILPRRASGGFDASSLTHLTARDSELGVLDLVGVLHASQALSRQVSRDSLLTQLMELVIETAGAEAGSLLLPGDDDWVVVVEKSAVGERAQVVPSIPIDELVAQGHPGVPTSIVRYVARTRDSVVLDNATADSRFGSDPHIGSHGIKSALCFALARHSGQPAILYLENNLVTGAFTPARIQVLQLLSTQAVISLDNAQLYANLEQKVEERTRELAHKNRELATTLDTLRETQDRLIVQERLASLGALTAGIAHELRNPLNFVNNFARLSRKQLGKLTGVLDELAATPGDDGADAGERVSRIMRSLERNVTKIEDHGQRIDGIVTSMLEHSRESAGQRVDTDINALLRDSVQLARNGSSVHYSGLDCRTEFDLDDDLAPVHVVPQEIGRVIINLVNNACHALMRRRTAAGNEFAPRLTVTSRGRDEAVEIRVRDNGTGIPAAIRDQIFDPFFTTKETGEGTGLGLSISHEIISQGYGGSLTVDSREGEFTEFTIVLPRR